MPGVFEDAWTAHLREIEHLKIEVNELKIEQVKMKENQDESQAKMKELEILQIKLLQVKVNDLTAQVKELTAQVKELKDELPTPKFKGSLRHMFRLSELKVINLEQDRDNFRVSLGLISLEMKRLKRELGLPSLEVDTGSGSRQTVVEP